MFETSKTAQVTNEMEEYRIVILDIRESKRKNKNKTRKHKMPCSSNSRDADK